METMLSTKFGRVCPTSSRPSSPPPTTTTTAKATLLTSPRGLPLGRPPSGGWSFGRYERCRVKMSSNHIAPDTLSGVNEILRACERERFVLGVAPRGRVVIPHGSPGVAPKQRSPETRPLGVPASHQVPAAILARLVGSRCARPRGAAARAAPPPPAHARYGGGRGRVGHGGVCRGARCAVVGQQLRHLGRRLLLLEVVPRVVPLAAGA